MLDVMNSTEYEKVAQQVYQAILATEEVETIKVLHNVLITGRSGVAHQIDVYWRYLKDGVEHQVLVGANTTNPPSTSSTPGTSWVCSKTFPTAKGCCSPQWAFKAAW